MPEITTGPTLPAVESARPVSRPFGKLRYLYAGLLAIVLSALPAAPENQSAERTSDPRPVVPTGSLVTTSGAKESPKPMPTPHAGAYVIAGGGTLPKEIHDRFRQLAGGDAARICVIPTASEDADGPGQPQQDIDFYTRRWRVPVQVLHTRKRERADDPQFVQPLRESTAAWLSIGDQRTLAGPYRRTLVERELQNLLERGGVIGGTSAGASAMSWRMIAGGTAVADLDTGLDLAPRGWVIDQHFMNRGRLQRLLGVVDSQPDAVGIGVDEGTALVVRAVTEEGRRTFKATVMGRANVRICEPRRNVRVLKAGDTVELNGSPLKR